MQVQPGASAASLSSPQPLPHPGDRSLFWRRSALAASAVSLVAVGALAATLLQRNAAPAAGAAPLATTTPSADGAPSVALAQGSTPAARAQPAPGLRKQVDSATASHNTGSTPLRTQPANDATPAPTACAHCGVVQSVSAVSHKGPGTGIGAVAGGVLGGVVGHQIGNGNGRKAMTVLGAIGGGLAGHEIEKRQRATTDYRVTVRMADGSLRTLNQVHAPDVGQAVRIAGDKLVTISAPARRTPPPAANEGELRTLQTSQRS